MGFNVDDLNVGAQMKVGTGIVPAIKEGDQSINLGDPAATSVGIPIQEFIHTPDRHPIPCTLRTPIVMVELSIFRTQ